MCNGVRFHVAQSIVKKSKVDNIKAHICRVAIQGKVTGETLRSWINFPRDTLARYSVHLNMTGSL